MLEDLKAKAKPISTPGEIRQVATIASNGDEKVGGLIAEAFEKARAAREHRVRVAS